MNCKFFLSRKWRRAIHTKQHSHFVHAKSVGGGNADQEACQPLILSGTVLLPFPPRLDFPRQRILPSTHSHTRKEPPLPTVTRPNLSFHPNKANRCAHALQAPLMASWTSSPTRRELTLFLFCVTIFIVAFNASTSLRLLSLNSSSLIPFSSRHAPIGSDGRKPEGYRDRLENEIFGEWDWEPGHIAAVKEAESARVMHGKPYDHPDAYIHGEGRSGEQAMWLQGVGEGRYGQGEGLGQTSVNDELVHWSEDVPRAQLKQHVPGASSFCSAGKAHAANRDYPSPIGFTILDNVILFNGGFFVVADDVTSMPPVEAIGSSMENHRDAPRDIDWQVFPAQTAPIKFGSFGGRCAPSRLLKMF